MDYSFQTEIKAKVVEELKTNKYVWLGCHVGAGKTNMTLDIIKEYYKNKLICILGYREITIRDQWVERSAQMGIQAHVVAPGVDRKELKTLKSGVVVGLPQSFVNCKELNGKKFDLIVVDECHIGFNKKQVAEIIKKLGKPKVLMLSATGHAIADQVKATRITRALDKGYESGIVANVKTCIVRSSYKWDDERNSEDELSTEQTESINKEDTESSINNLIQDMLHIVKNNTKVKKVLSKIKIESKIGKTLIVCKSIKQARYVNDYLNSINYKSLISNSIDDVEITQIDAFKSDPKANFLVVVGRAKIGFDYPDLINLVDMSGTLNCDLIYQLIGRVSRQSSSKADKYFYKFATPRDYTAVVAHMNLTMLYFDTDFYSSFNGKYKQVPVPRQYLARSPGEKVVSDTPRDTVKPMKDVGVDPEVESILDGRDFFNQLKYKDNGTFITRELTIKEFIRLQKLESRGDTDSEGKKALLLEMLRRGEPRPKKGSKLGSSLGGYIHRNNTSFDSEFKNKIEELDLEIFPDSVGWTGWNYNKCKNVASKYNSLSELEKNPGGSYNYMVKNKITKQIAKELGWKCRNTWDETSILEEAKKYKTRTEWSKNSSGSYNKSKQLGLLDKYCSHMKPSASKKRKVRIVETEQEFESLAELARFLGVNSGSVGQALKKGIKVKGYTIEYID